MGKRGPKPRIPNKAFILSKIKINHNGCWEWQGRKTHGGYGQESFGAKVRIRVHRLALHLWKGFNLTSKLKRKTWRHI